MFAANVVDAVQDLPIVGDVVNGVVNAVGDLADPVLGLVTGLLGLGG
ncbi:hypothetical protein GMA10_10200 [Kocuria koreensis]|jgi:hypothetical protein|uniref:Uncharacterized protein n=1 Tax=Rothia koreensis TaxID=592378 RepID=A0A7K1LK52_9MICC|nr:hypothetical protein [Rothia koreensis]MUN55578.1 hypothetical protein [Rothia koreensis]